MKTAIVKFSDVADAVKNPTLCLSARRYTGGCYECLVSGYLKYDLKRAGNLDAILKKVKCNPIITEAAIAAHKEKERLLRERELLQAKIEAIDKKIEEGI